MENMGLNFDVKYSEKRFIILIVNVKIYWKIKKEFN